MKRILFAVLLLLVSSSVCIAQVRGSRVTTPSPLIPDGSGGYTLPGDLTTTGLDVGTTTQKTTIDPTTGTTTYALNVGTPLASANVEKTVLYFNMVNTSGVTLPGVYLAVEMTDGTNARSGLTLYTTNVNGTAIPVLSTYGAITANPVTGVSVYETGGTVYVKQANGTLKALVMTTP